MSTRSSPPTRRVIAVLEALATAPVEPSTLSALAARTGTSKATCLGLLNELTAAGWVRRPTARGYQLGPAVLALGVAASAVEPGIAAARPRLAALAREAGGAVTASARRGATIAVLARVGDPAVAPEVRVGARFPAAPPSGVMFVAWDGAAAVEAWLAAVPLPGVVPAAPQLRRVAAAARRRGSLAERAVDASGELLTALAAVGDADLPDRLAQLVDRLLGPGARRHYLTRDLRPGETAEVTQVCAPVFGPDGRTAWLVACFLGRSVDRGELRRVTTALLATAGELTAVAGGFDPWR